MKLARVTYENPDMRLTEFVRTTTLDHVSVIECENLSEFQTATTTAYNVKQEAREDGYKYVISRSTSKKSVYIRLDNGKG